MQLRTIVPPSTLSIACQAVLAAFSIGFASAPVQAQTVGTTGGNGADFANVIGQWSVFSAASIGGAGGDGLVAAGTVTNNNAVTGGTGGKGGNNTTVASLFGLGPSGATGGAGGAGVSGTGFTLTNTNTGTITGGTGGTGGQGAGGAATAGSGGTGGAGGAGVTGSAYVLTNSGTISGGAGGSGGQPGVGGAAGSVGAAGASGSAVVSTGNASVTNYGNISTTGGTAAILLSGTGNALKLVAGSTVSGGIGIDNSGTIDSLQNFGAITGSSVGVRNAGTITALTNAQSNLTYQGALPASYLVRIDSPTAYGKASFSGATGTTSFGIASGSTVSVGTYTGVLNGLATSNLSALTGSFGLLNWTLNNSGGNLWDLVVANRIAVLGSSTTMGNVPTYAAARVIDTHANLLGLFGNLGGDRAVSNAASQTLPLLTGGSMLAAQGALSGINRVIQARIDGNHGMSSGDDVYGDKHFWLKPFGSWADQNDRHGVSGYKANTYGLATGFDGALSSALRMGGAFAYARADVDGKSAVAPQSANVDVYQLIAYGSYLMDERTELNFQADVGRNDNKGRRQIAFASSVAASSYASQTGHVGAGIGRNYALSEQTTLTPSVRADYTWIKDKAYSETGAGLLNLNVGSRSTEAFVVGLDGKLAHRLNEQTTLTAILGVGYDTLNKQSSITAAFAGAPDAAFVTYGINPSPWIGRAGLGTVYKAKSGVEITGRYDAEYRESFLNQTASLKFRWAF